MIIAGDINQLLIIDFCLQNNLIQLVTKPTRGKKTLEVFITNYPHLWKSPTIFKGLVRSDHMAIVVNPQFLAKPERKYVCFRDVREHRKIKMEKKLAEYDWSTIASVQDLDIAACKRNDSILSLINECFPQIKVRISSRDPPFMSPLVKHLCNLRNKQIKMGINPDLQNQINKLIRNHQIRAVRQENKKHKQGSRGWWRTVDRMTGRKTKTTNISSTIDPESINTYFHNINSDAYYTTPERVVIPEDTRLPMIEAHVVEKFLMKQKRTAAGPDEIPYWIWRDYAPFLAPMVTKIVNLSLNQQHVPLIWKLANITPIPKESPLVDCSQLRPISLTNIIIRIVERIIFEQEISLQAKMLIDKDQQAFDSVPHDIICDKLKATSLNPYVINWIIDFLIDRKQRVVVDGLETEYVDITRGVPQGTVLGPFLFSLMVNDIKPADGDNNLLVKFADDITVSAPVKNGKDTALTEVTNIKDWANNNRMIVKHGKWY